MMCRWGADPLRYASTAVAGLTAHIVTSTIQQVAAFIRVNPLTHCKPPLCYGGMVLPRCSRTDVVSSFPYCLLHYYCYYNYKIEFCLRQCSHVTTFRRIALASTSLTGSKFRPLHNEHSHSIAYRGGSNDTALVLLKKKSGSMNSALVVVYKRGFSRFSYHRWYAGFVTTPYVEALGKNVVASKRHL